MARRAAVIGSMREFNPESEKISAYLERMTIYFSANDIAEAKQAAVLLTVIGPQTYSLLRSLTAPDLPHDKAYAALSALLKSHFEPKPLVIAERFHFHRRNQRGDESTAVFVAELRRLSAYCEFGDLDDALRDRLVCGLRNESIQKRLLSEANLTYQRAMELAQGMEAAEQNSRLLKSTEPAINQVSNGSPSNSRERQPCFRCGRTNHSEAHCRFKNSDCHRCGKLGHIAPVCTSKTVQNKEVQNKEDHRTHMFSTHYIQEEVEEDSDNELHLF